MSKKSRAARRRMPQPEAQAASQPSSLLMLGEFTVPEFDRLSMAFGARLNQYPEMSIIPEEFRRHSGRFQEIVSSIFFRGGTIESFGLRLKPSLNRPAAMAAIRAWLCSFDPKHEHKTATIAWALSEWCEAVK